jgi:amidohydrolase
MNPAQSQNPQSAASSQISHSGGMGDRRRFSPALSKHSHPSERPMLGKVEMGVTLPDDRRSDGQTSHTFQRTPLGSTNSRSMDCRGCRYRFVIIARAWQPAGQQSRFDENRPVTNITFASVAMPHPLRCLALLLVGVLPLRAQTTQPAVASDIDRRIAAVLPRVVAWRRDIHEHPELSYQEVRTSALVARHLKALGLEVQTSVGGTHGVVALLRGARPGPTVALRADMDGLPVTEQVELPFRSRVRATYNGQDVGVMHACGHDNHVAILMGAAEVLAGMKSQLAGNVKFIFQPAEESPPDGGAKPLIAAGALENPTVDAIFGLHVFPGRVGTVTYLAGPMYASADSYKIIVHGRQTHGAIPWSGIDPIVVGSQIVLGLQTIVSRQVDLSGANAIVTVGAFNAGNRHNIIPDSAVLIGTIRTFSEGVRSEIHARITRTAESIAAAAGGRATVAIELGYPVTVNDPRLVARMVPTLERAAGAANVSVQSRTTTAEDFSRYAEKVPGMIFSLGVTPASKDPRAAAANHSPLFEADEAALPVGIRLMTSLAVDFLAGR